MQEINHDFLKEVFRETNSHMRATDRKSLIVTGAYISLFSVFLSSIAIGRWSNSGAPSPWVQITVQGFFLVVGSCIFVMQHWYRAWKVHYIEVCLEIRKHFMTDSENLRLLPYWLRKEMPQSKVSIDNLLKSLTAIINFLLVFLIAYDLLNEVPNRSLGILLVAVLILAYLSVLYATDRVVSKGRELFA